jgi:hypothetical protein
VSKSFSDYGPMEQLAIKQALYKVLAADVDTKDPYNLRGYVSAGIIEQYRQTGAKSYDLRIDGTKVGTMGVSVSKETEERHEKRFRVADDAALDAWVRGNDAQAFWDAFITSHRDVFAKWYFECMGELPDGCEMADVTIPAKPSQVTGTSLRVKPEKVREALGANLPTAVAGLLEG